MYNAPVQPGILHISRQTNSADNHRVQVLEPAHAGKLVFPRPITKLENGRIQTPRNFVRDANSVFTEEICRLLILYGL